MLSRSSVCDFRRNSTLLTKSSIDQIQQRKHSISLNILPKQNDQYLCVPSDLCQQQQQTVRYSKSSEYFYIDTADTIKRIESYTSLSIPEDFKFAEINIKLHKFRWFLLFLCILLNAISFMQWIQFSIISDKISKYYNVNDEMINWTSMVFMVMYILFVFPVSYFIENRSLRETAIYATVGTTIGSWIKMCSLEKDRFRILLAGQIFVAFSQIFVLSIPTKLACTWFAPGEMSTVCGSGVFGGQLGVALGFFITPLLTNRKDDLSKIDLHYLNFLTATLSTVIAIIVCIVFKTEPKYPPSTVQALARSSSVSNQSYWQSTWILLHDRNFSKIIIGYGINIGTLNALSTLLNQIIYDYFPDSNQDAGNIGAVIIIMGLFGSMVFGVIIDKTHEYKMTAVSVSGLSVVGMGFFIMALSQKSIIYIYVSSIILGFFMTGYQTVGQELAAEYIFPNPDSTVTAILNISSHIFGIKLTLILSFLEKHFGHYIQHLAFIGILLIGTFILTRFQMEKRRTIAHEEVDVTVNELAEFELDSNSSNIKVKVEFIMGDDKE